MRDLLSEAKKLVKMRGISLFPGWNFATADSLNDKRAIERKKIWKFFNLRKRHPEIIVRWDSGLRLSLRLGDDISWCLFVGGQIDPNEFAFLDEFLKPDMVVVDAGANSGLYTLFCAKRVGLMGKVIAIEPSSREIKQLKENIKLNSFKNINILPMTLSDHKKRKTFHIASEIHSGQNTFGEFVYLGVNKNNDEVVQMETLDNLATDLKLDRLDFIKMDIEGSEYKALVGGIKTLKKFKPVILLEISPESLKKQKSSVRQVFSYLKRFNYCLYYFDSTGKPKRIEKSIKNSDLSLNILAIQ